MIQLTPLFITRASVNQIPSENKILDNCKWWSETQWRRRREGLHTRGKNSKGGGSVRGTSVKIMESLGKLVQAW
jgi:hypothetical protein